MQSVTTNPDKRRLYPTNYNGRATRIMADHPGPCHHRGQIWRKTWSA